MTSFQKFTFMIGRLNFLTDGVKFCIIAPLPTNSLPVTDRFMNSPYLEVFIFVLGWELIHGRQRKSMDLKAIFTVFLSWKLAIVLQL